MTKLFADAYPNYRIECDNKHPRATYTVFHRTTGEQFSHHDTSEGAKEAAKRYQSADDRRGG